MPIQVPTAPPMTTIAANSPAASHLAMTDAVASATLAMASTLLLPARSADASAERGARTDVSLSAAP